MCERPLPPQRRPGRADTRDHAHASHLKEGDRMGTHTDAHITGTQEAQRKARGKAGGAYACRGGQGGHNGRMWRIVLTHGATGRGLPRANASA